MSAESSRKVRKSSILFPLRAPLLEWQGKLNEAQSAGRDCPGSGAAGPLAATAWTEIPATAGYTALCLPLLPGVTKLVSH